MESSESSESLSTTLAKQQTLEESSDLPVTSSPRSQPPSFMSSGQKSQWTGSMGRGRARGLARARGRSTSKGFGELSSSSAQEKKPGGLSDFDPLNPQEKDGTTGIRRPSGRMADHVELASATGKSCMWCQPFIRLCTLQST